MIKIFFLITLTFLIPLTNIDAQNLEKDVLTNSNINLKNEAISDAMALAEIIAEAIIKEYSEELTKVLKSGNQESLQILVSEIKNENLILDCFDIADLIFQERDAPSLLIKCQEIIDALGGTNKLIQISINHLTTKVLLGHLDF